MFIQAINFAQHVAHSGVSYNFTYLILFIGIAIVSDILQANLKSKFEKYSKMPVAMTGHDVAVKMLHDNGIYDVKVTCTPGTLTAHYNPVTKPVNLSQGVYNSASVAAVAVAAHECGHAMQHDEGYAPVSYTHLTLPTILRV